MSLELIVGELKGQLSAMKTEIAEMKLQNKNIEDKVDTVLDTIAQTKGGWKTISFLLAAGAGIGTLLSKLLAKIII